MTLTLDEEEGLMEEGTSGHGLLGLGNIVETHREMPLHRINVR